ncbi:serine hydrolase, partial [Modestobacter sp. KNN46-3]
MHLHLLRHRGWLAALLGLLTVGVATVAIVGCCITGVEAVAGRSVASSPPTISAPPSTAALATATPSIDPAAVLANVRAAAAAAQGSIRVVVLDPDGRPLITGPDAGAPTYTASLVKILVVARLLALDAAGSLALSGEDLDLVQRAVVQSDDGAMSRLWDRYDGAQLVRHVATAVGLTGTRLPAVPGQWGQAVTTAADVATVLSALGDILDDDDVETLLGWMRSTSAIAADGFDQWFGLLAPVHGG